MALLCTNLAAGLVLIVASDVVIDMPPPPAVESDRTIQISTTPLHRFSEREVAQDPAGNARGVEVSRVLTERSLSYGGLRLDGYARYNWGWPGMCLGVWEIQPMYWGGGWVSWANFCGGYWSGAYLGCAGAVNLRVGRSCW